MSKFEFTGFVTVRTSSSRLPKKCLLPFGNDNIISHIIKRTQAYNIEPIVCTSIEQTDDIIEDICNKKKIKVFRGSINNKIKRWCNCASHFNIDYFHTIDADDPFFDGNEMKRSMQLLKNENLDFVEPYDYSKAGAGVLGYSFKSKYLSSVNSRILENTNTEHLPKYIYNNDHYKKKTLEQIENIEINMRLTLDYEEDFILLNFVRRLLGNLATREDINNLFIQNPDLHKINWFRKDDYLSNQNI